MAKLAAMRYARALFEIALEESSADKNSLNKMEAEVIILTKLLKENKELANVMLHPQITASEKMNIFTNAFKGNLSDHIFGLLNVVLQKNREAELIEIFDAFLSLCAQHKGNTTASVVSAVPLSEVQLSSIKNILSEKLNKQVKLEPSVDPDLIGGLYIKVDGCVFDGTIKKQLSDMKKQLLGFQLA